MSRTPERSTTIRLSVDEYAQVVALAKEREMQPEHWMTDIVRLALWERRDPTAPMRMREREVAMLKQEVVKLTTAIMSQKTETRQ